MQNRIFSPLPIIKAVYCILKYKAIIDKLQQKIYAVELHRFKSRSIVISLACQRSPELSKIL